MYPNGKNKKVQALISRWRINVNVGSFVTADDAKTAVIREWTKVCGMDKEAYRRYADSRRFRATSKWQPPVTEGALPRHTKFSWMPPTRNARRGQATVYRWGHTVHVGCYGSKEDAYEPTMRVWRQVRSYNREQFAAYAEGKKRRTAQ